MYPELIKTSAEKYHLNTIVKIICRYIIFNLDKFEYKFDAIWE